MAAAAAQFAFGRGAAWANACYGSIALFIGTALLVVAVAISSAALFIAATLIIGLGFGTAYLGALRTMSAAVPAEHRARTMSAFYIVTYIAMSLYAIAAGLCATPFGLTTTMEWFGSVIAVIAALVAAEAWRQRPTQPQADLALIEAEVVP